ncbi:MAG: hypothetical protein WHV44_07295, partial [Anaerolineales bacterium]
RGQGADPQVIRARRPRLAQLAEHTLRDALPLAAPVAAYQRLGVKKVLHDVVILENGGKLSGPLVARMLAPARAVIAAVCTIGPALETLSLQALESDPPLSLALYGVGSAAVEALSRAVCRHFGEQAAAQGWQSTAPLSPGLEGWPLAAGQAEIFALVPEAAQIGVTLLPSSVMLPRKSVSLVIGLGPGVDAQSTVCDFCAARQACRHRGQIHTPSTNFDRE